MATMSENSQERLWRLKKDFSVEHIANITRVLYLLTHTLNTTCKRYHKTLVTLAATRRKTINSFDGSCNRVRFQGIVGRGGWGCLIYGVRQLHIQSIGFTYETDKSLILNNKQLQ